MKKIGIDARFFTERATGVGRHVYELVQGLAKLDSINEYTIFLKPEEFETFQVPASNFKKELTTAKHYSVAEQWGFCKQLYAYHFDLMVFPQFNVPLLYFRPYVITVHDLTLHLFPGKKKTDFISRLAYKLIINIAVRKAKHCFAVSENTKKDMMKYLGISEEKITVTYNGVTKTFEPILDQNILQEFKAKQGLPDQYFLYTGVFRSHKNVVGLIEAYAEFLKKYPEFAIDLVLAGPPDKTYSEVPDTIQKLGLEKQVHILGILSTSELAKLVCGALAYVFPSFYEGFGIPPIEAMQCGVPVACSNTSSLPEVCGDAVEYFDPYSKNAIVSALETVAFNGEKRKILIERGFIQCEKFKWEDMVKKMFDVYKKVLFTA